MAYDSYHDVLPWIDINLDDSILNGIKKYCKLVTFNKGDTLLRQGEYLECMYFLLEGSIKISTITIDGNEKTFWHNLKGSIVGEVPYYHHMESNASILAEEDSKVYVLDGQSIKSISKECPELYDVLLSSMSKKIRILINQISDITHTNPKQRVCKLLYMLVQSYGYDVEIGTQIKLPITHKEIGSILSLHRVTVTNIFSELKKRGIAEKLKSGTILIKDIVSLEECCKL